MTDLFDFGFDDPAPAEVKAPPPPSPPARPERCERKAYPGGYVCRVGGGDASFSDNLARTWFCRRHAPADFFKHLNRGTAHG